MSAALSSYWRKNISPSEAQELGNLLRALRKIVGHLGSNVGDIEYIGMSRGGGGKILLDPQMAVGEYPVPPEKVDHLAGMVIHEALGHIEWSDHVWKLLEPEFEKMAALKRISFQKLIKVGEDIYVDLIADQNIFGLYVAKAREEALKENQKQLGSELSVDRLFHLWWERTWAQGSAQKIEPDYKPSLAVLNRLSRDLGEIGFRKNGVTARCQKRSELYLETWQAITEAISSWKVVNRMLYWYPSSTSEKKKNGGQKKIEKKHPESLPAELAEEIETQLAVNSVNITPIIRTIVGPDNDTVEPTSLWDFNIPAYPMIDKRLVSRLKAIFINYAGHTKLNSRGLQSGKLDRHRLYRAPVSGRCFRQIEYKPDLDWQVTLLIDASGSMRGNKWRMVENTLANIHQALKGYRNRLQAYGYFESDGICMISHLIKGRDLLSVPPGGLTASGQALIAAAYFMPKERRRKILIHVTDGESNFGCDVQHGIDYCQKNKIHLVTLGCGYKDRESMEHQYGKTIQFLDHFGQLPRAMERLFKWTFLYGVKTRNN
jgi:hypothetical protein